MELKVSEWKEFKVNRIFLCETTILSIKDILDEGSVPFISRTAENNGCDGYVDVSADAITKGHCLTVGAEGVYCFYQPVDFATGNKVYTLRNTDLTMNQYLFIATILNQEDYKYNYGRARIKSKLENEILRLPIQHNAAGQPVIDQSRKYSDDGYVPDWDFMEQYMKSLNTQPLVTQRGGSALPTLGVDRWKEFQVGRLFKLNIAKSVDYGNTTSGDTIFVGRTSENNGVQGYVSEVPVEDGNCIIIGMVGSNWAFYQGEPFVASQNILVLRNEVLNRPIAMFLCSVLSKCVEIYRDTYSLPLGKEKMKDRVVKLPIQHDISGNPIIDPSKKYSDDGYIPDWVFMEKYIGSLPGSDLI